MSKKRVHEIAKEHGLSSKELLEKLKAAGIEAKAAASSVDEAAALKALGAGRRRAPTASERARRAARADASSGRRRPPAAAAGSRGSPRTGAERRERGRLDGHGTSRSRRPRRSAPRPRAAAATAAGAASRGRPSGSATPRRRLERGRRRGSRRRARAPDARLAHRRAHARRHRPRRAPARRDRLAGLAPPAGRPVQPAPAPPAPRPPPPRHLRRDDRADRHGCDGGHRPDPRQLGLDRQGRRRVPRRGGARDHQEADVAGRDGDAHADALRRRHPGAGGRVRQEDRDRPRRRRRRGRAGIRGRRGGSDRASAGRHDHGPRRPRQDLAAGRDPRDRGRRGRGRRHHPAHRRLPGAPRRQGDHLPRHARPRGVHGDARARREASPTWR